jgi:uncharacterized protein YbaP (TraB family)
MTRPVAWITALLLLIAGSVAAQKPVKEGLLWEISGNGLQKPSYLFGTMHSRDKRVFNMPDSVIIAFDKCPAFAAELNMDSLVSEMLSMIFEPDTSVKDVNDLLSDKELKELDKKFREEQDISINDLRRREPWVVDLMLDKEAAKKGDHKTFLDAYLFKLAKSRGKKVIGIETFQEQASIFRDMPSDQQRSMLLSRIDDDSDDKKVKNLKKELEQYYLAGDLKKLDSLMRNSGMSPEFFRRLITERNVRMAQRIAVHIRQQPTFIAVGAGHLPGDSGVIMLLRKQGFSVRPVQATYSGMAAEYISKPLVPEWYTFTPGGKGLSIEIPAKPYSFPLKSLVDMDMSILLDLTSGISYYITVMQTPMTAAASAEQLEKLYDMMIKGMTSKNGAKVTGRKKVEIAGSNAVEMVMSTGKGSYRTRIVIHGDKLVLVMAGSEDKELLRSKDAERFFTSLKLDPVEEKIAAPQGSWKEITSEEGAFTVEMPSEPEKNNKNVELDPGKNITLHMLTSIDASTGTSFVARYNDFYPGYVVSNDTMYFSSMLDLFLGEENKLLAKKDIMLGQYPGMEYTIDAREGTELKIRVFIRSSRVYVLVAGYMEDKKNDPSIDRFLRSMKLIPYLQTAWKPYTSDRQDFTVKMPSVPEPAHDTLSRTPNPKSQSSNIETFSQYSSIDPNTGTSFVVTVETFSDYYQSANEEEFFSSAIENLGDYNDSVISKSPFSIGNYPAREVILGNATDHCVKRYLVVLAGNKMYKLLAYLPRWEATSPIHKVFFESFRISKAEGNVFANKKDKFFKDVLSSDPVVRDKAAKAVGSFEFGKEDILQVCEVLKHDQPDDGETYGVRNMLFDALPSIADEGTISFIEQLYPKLPKVPELQLRALNVLTNINSKGSIRSFGKLLTANPPAVETSWRVSYVFGPLYDTLQNSKVLFPSILELLKVEGFREPVLRFVSAMRDSNVIAQEMIVPYTPVVQDIASAELDKRSRLTKSDEAYYSSAYTMEEIAKGLGYFYNDRSQQLLNSMLKDSFPAVRMAAASSLFRHDQKVDEKVLSSIASDLEYRLELYKSLKKMNKLSLFPKKYLSQKMFAESNLAVWVSYEFDAMPDKIEYMAKKKIMHSGREVNVYLFKFLYIYEGKSEWYVGISGPQPANEKEVMISNELTGSDYLQPDAKSVNEHFENLLKKMQE